MLLAGEVEMQVGGAVRSLAWVGRSLVVSVGLKYFIAAPLANAAGAGGKGGCRELFEVPTELAYSPVLAQGLPWIVQAMLVVVRV